MLDLKLQGKRALITGSSAGIGKAIATLLAEQGAKVVIHGLQLQEAEQVAEQINSSGGDASAVAADLSQDQQAEMLVDQTLSVLGGVDILGNIAGAYPWRGWMESPAQEWLDTYNLDVVSCVRLIRGLVPAMKEQGWGRVINMSSASAIRSPANYAPAYACAKAAQTHMCKSLAVELRNTGITVNAISPGPVATETTKRLFIGAAEQEGRSTRWEDIEQHFVETTMHEPPVPRMAEPEEIASLFAYLCSPHADIITGADYMADCGYSVSGFRPIS